MGRLVKLPQVCNDVPGSTCWVEVPRYDAVLRSLFIVGRLAAEIERLAVRVNGLYVCMLEPFTDDDGKRRTGGELGLRLQAMRGFSPGKIVVPIDPIGLQWVQHVDVQITLAAGVEPGRTQLFAKLAR